MQKKGKSKQTEVIKYIVMIQELNKNKVQIC